MKTSSLCMYFVYRMCNGKVEQRPLIRSRLSFISVAIVLYRDVCNYFCQPMQISPSETVTCSAILCWVSIWILKALWLLFTHAKSQNQYLICHPVFWFRAVWFVLKYLKVGSSCQPHFLPTVRKKIENSCN